MQKYRFANPDSVVEVSQSTFPQSGNTYTMYDCLCRGFGQNNKAPRRQYKIAARSQFSAAQTAIKYYRQDCFGDGKESD